MKDTKEIILKVALGLFLQDSFKGVTMNQIVKLTGMSKGAFYHYFKSKEQLFEEILNSYFLDSVALDYSKFSKESLYQFGRDYLSEIEKSIVVPKGSTKLSPHHTNYFFLIFEGMKAFPSFRRKMNDNQKTELAAWKTIVGTARKKREIKSRMTDEQIAKLFIFITDGVGTRLIMGNRLEDMEDEILSLWDGLYNQLKA